MSTQNYITSDERIKQYNEELTAQNSDIAVEGAFIVSAIVALTLSIINFYSISTFISFFYVLGSGFAAFFAQRFFGSRMKYLSEVICIVFLMLTVPHQWFFTGGFYGVGNIWFIFTAIYVMFGSHGKVRTTLLSIISIEIFVTVIATYIMPDFVNDLSDTNTRILSMVSIIVVTLYVLYVGTKQKLLADENAVKIAMMQDDLTAQNQELIAINDELIDLADKLKTANETQRHFTASMNHELRSPLNGIEGCLQILLVGGKLDEEDSDTIKNALVSCKSITQTVNDLLDFSKLEEGKFDIVKRPFDLRDMLDNILSLFSAQASAKNLEFQIRIPRSTRVSIFADNVRIQQVLNNLLSNAIKYTKSGKIVLSVSTSSYHLNFKVSDTGQGMSEDELAVIFEPFTRFNMQENVHIQGTGLGMNIVSNLLKEMKGTIDVSSKKGIGTTFHVSIPVMYFDSDVIFASPRKEEAPEVEVGELDGLRILSVDDLKINRNILRGLLKKCNVELMDLDSGRKAVSECFNKKYDIIILDHMMPDMDGIQTLDAIREEGLNTTTPVIMLTGNSGKEYSDLYHEHGASGYLEKPILYDDLIAEIKKACGK